LSALAICRCSDGHWSRAAIHGCADAAIELPNPTVQKSDRSTLQRRGHQIREAETAL
jgi:hypothetical protein